MTEVAEITIQKLWEPFPTAKPWKDGKRRGKIVSAEGENFQVPETMLREFSLNEVCKVEYKTFGDKTNPGKDIVKKIWTGDNKHMAPGHVSPKPLARPRMDPADARGAFITVILEAFVKAGKVPLNRDAIATARQEIGAGYDESQRTPMGEIMNDEIPFFPKSENPADA